MNQVRTIDTDQQIRALLLSGLSVRNVANALDVSKSAVGRIRKSMPDVTPASKIGRPEKLSLVNQRYCVRSLKTQDLKTAKQVQKSLENDLNVLVSERTVRRALNAGGLKAAEKKKKPLLSQKHRKDRLAFGKRHEYWTVEDWKRVIWSDKTKINRFCSDGRSWCWVHKKAT